MPRCKGADCGAEVIYVPSAKSGKAMVLDAKAAKAVVVFDPILKRPVPANLMHDARTDKLIAVVADVYTPHHATCPNADSFRRKAGAEEDSHR